MSADDERRREYIDSHPDLMEAGGRVYIRGANGGEVVLTDDVRVEPCPTCGDMTMISRGRSNCCGAIADPDVEAAVRRARAMLGYAASIQGDELEMGLDGSIRRRADLPLKRRVRDRIVGAWDRLTGGVSR